MGYILADSLVRVLSMVPAAAERQTLPISTWWKADAKRYALTCQGFGRCEMAELDKDWSRKVAALAADALVDAGLLRREDAQKAADVVAPEIVVRLAMEDRPSRSSV